MRLTILGPGSRGDVQPLIALGAAMRARGHDVLMATHPDLEHLVREAFLGFYPIPGKSTDYFKRPELQNAIRSKWAAASMLVRRTCGLGASDEAVAYSKLDAYLNRALDNTDLIVTNDLRRFSLLAAAPEIPWTYVTWYPISPTRRFPAMAAPRLPLGGWYNKATHHIAQTVDWLVARPMVNAYRRLLGRTPRGVRPPFELMLSDRPVFCLQSPAVVPPPHDWPPNRKLAGYWFWDREVAPSDELIRDLHGDTPLVVLSFGSLWSNFPSGSLTKVARAVSEMGYRLVAIDAPEENAPDNVLRLRDVDYSWLFPKAAVVVHHGGFGTGAAALRAGVPQVVVPIFFDHPYWANLMATLGVAPSPIPAKKLTAERIERAIARAVSDRTMNSRAAEIGRAVREERGLDSACETLETWVAGTA